MEIPKDLMESLAELKVEKEIKDLEHKYVRSIDARNYKTTADFFQKDGNLYWKDELISGKSKIEAWFKMIADWDFIFARHVITNPIVTVSGQNEASFTSYYYAIFSHETFTKVTVGFYDDQLVKENGEWKIKEKRIIVAWSDTLVALNDLKQKTN